MKFINREMYLKFSTQERHKLWKEVIGNSELRILGEVDKIEDTYSVIKNPRRYSKEQKSVEISDPLAESYPLKIVMGLKDVSDELKKKKILKGDYISFSLKIEEGEIEPTKNPIIIKKNTIEKMYNIKEQFKDYSVNETGELQYASKSLQDYLEDVNKETVKLADEKDSLKKEIKYLYHLLTLEKEQIDNQLNQFKQEKLKTIKNEIEDLEATKTSLFAYRIFLPDEEEKKETIAELDSKKIENPQDALQYIQSYLASDAENPLYYDLKTLTKFYAALRTDQLVVLAGSPGTGKSSLVNGFAEAIGAEFRIIPVQPNWVDKSDLLGFYNPIEKAYISTPFLDVILEAKKKENKNKLFIICLDEMNLAHVEYYFAEFLSKLQTDRIIDLYSNNLKKDIESELHERYAYFTDTIKELSVDEFLKHNDKVDLDNYFSLKKQANHIKKYDPFLEIPKNIRFVGTINKDETTKDLSPKVIDRCFFIRLGGADMKKIEETQATLIDKRFLREPLTWTIGDIVVNKGTLDERLQEYVISLTSELSRHGIVLTNRFNRTVQQLASIDIFNNNYNDILDILYTSLVLPKVSSDQYETNIEQLYETLNKYILSGMKCSDEMLDSMRIKDLKGELQALTYWRQ